ncbi:MAG: D-alanyl-D-alanine carboxypeptidase/D-alanyl-D-alanine-endopeptidase [Simkaniaceae bacterium]
MGLHLVVSMKLAFLFLIFSFSLFAQNSKKAYLKERIERVLFEMDPSIQVGIEIFHLLTHETLYSRNSQMRMVPASTSKLFTTAAAFEELGPAFRFETLVATRGKIREGRVNTLYIKGSGDPSLKEKDLLNIVMRLKEASIDTVEGDLIIDDFAFDSFYKAPGWMWDDVPTLYCPYISALNVDHNRLTLLVEPSSQLNTKPFVRIRAAGESALIDNQAIMGKESTKLKAERTFNGSNHQITLIGEMALEEEIKKLKVPLSTPSVHTAELFASLMRKSGISFKGEVRKGRMPLDCKILAMHKSLSLQELAKKILKKSDNFYADTLFKHLGGGSWQGGSKRVRDFLQKNIGIALNEIVLLDGSGLSRYNLASARQLVQLLDWVDHSAAFSEEFKSSLSLSGIDGTLKNRFKDLNANTKIRGKTGTMTGVSSLAGYLITNEKEPLAFAIILNGFIGPCKEMKTLIEDALIKEMVNY